MLSVFIASDSRRLSPGPPDPHHFEPPPRGRFPNRTSGRRLRRARSVPCVLRAIYRGYRLTEGRDRLEGNADLYPGSDRCLGGHRRVVGRPDVSGSHPAEAPRSRCTRGAKAGDVTMHACTYKTEQGAMPADCGTLVVPENRASSKSRLMALPLTRVRSSSSRPLAPIFRLQGGPGVTNMKFSDASRLAAQHDVVMVGYRGVDGSSVLNCPEVSVALEHSADYLGNASLSAYSKAFASCAQRLERHGVDLGGYTLAEQADDIETARVALGYTRIDLVSESAGTRLAMI